MFGSIATLSWLFVQRLVPETKGRSLEEMEAYFEQLVRERGAISPATLLRPGAPSSSAVETEATGAAIR